MKQDKSSNKPPGRVYQKALVNVKDALCGLMMRSPTNEWGELPSPGIMLCQTSTQEARQNQYINNSVMKGNASIMHLGDTILDAAAETVIDEKLCLLDNQSTCNTFINGNTTQISEMLLMDNIYVSIVTQEINTPTRLVISRDILILCSITPRE